MDIISFNEASTANGRIENFNANPDSTSGIVTQPSIIQSGEIVSIPAGRTAIMANTVIDGTINLDGTMFIPSGSSVDFTNGITVNGSSIALSIPTSYHLLSGNLSVDNTVLTNGFGTKLFTRTSAGNLVVDTGIDMDTQWGSTSDERFGGLVWVKDRVTAGSGHVLQDTIRGAGYYLQTNNTGVNTYLASTLVSFNSNGFTYGDNLALNAGQVGWNFQTTHRKTGVTNHGKAYTEHYNPHTGFTMIKYEGSGINVHEIPHSLGRKLGLVVRKNLSAVADWCVVGTALGNDGYMYLNQTAQLVSSAGVIQAQKDDSTVSWNANNDNNASTNQYIMYGWANSYFDESNKLIGNYEIGVYQGTGVVGNKVTTRGKPAWVMIKKLDSAENWNIFDNMRVNGDNILFANLVDAEFNNSDQLDFTIDSFIIKTIGTNLNASGGQYLYMVVYDNDSGSGKSKYPKATDTANIQINNGIIPLAHGIDSNGSKNSIVVANETITGLTYTQGKNYLYKTDTVYGVKPYEPRMLSSELIRRFAGEQPDYYAVDSNKWFNTDAGSELVSNGKFSSGVTTGWTSTGTSSSLTAVAGMCKVSGTIDHGILGTISGLTIGKKYKITFYFDISLLPTKNLYFDGTAGMTLIPELSNTFALINNSYTLPNTGVYSYEFIASVTSGTFNVRNTANQTQDWYIDNISVFEADIVPTTEITESRNYMNHIVHADVDGGVLYVEELPKIEYKDIVKANEYQGKNACTAWVNFNGVTTPPTIRDSHNISAVIRTGLGRWDIYFKEEMDNINYAVSTTSTKSSTLVNSGDQTELSSTKKVNIVHYENATFADSYFMHIQVFGGKN